MGYPEHRSNGGSARLKLALVMGLAVSVLPTVAQGQDSDGGTITTGDPQADALIADIERVTAEFVEAREQFRSDRLDADALLDTIGREPDAILDWVAQETRWLPYEGALRGARGVLMDRSGSSLDRALVVADLLERSGLDVRLANATLPEAVASAAASAALARPWVPEPAPSFAGPEEIEGYRAAVDLAAEELAAEIGLLDEPAAAGREPAEVIADHWWVQAGADGQWHDYDPLLLDEAEGRPPAEATVDPAELPADLRHTVTVRVVIERLEDGELVEAVPLAYTVPMGTGEPGKLVRLDFRAWVPPEDVAVANETTDAVEGARLSSSWRPRLTLDGQTVNGEWFSESGRIEAPGGLAQADALSGGLDALGGLGAEPAEPDAVESTLSATWIEYETDGPGVEPRTERRELLDLAGPSRDASSRVDAERLAGDEADVRRGLAFLGDTEILLQTAATHPDATLDALVENWIELRPALIALLFLAADVEDERIGPSLAAPETQPVDLMAMAGAREQWALSPSAFVGRPQVWSRHLFYEPGDEGGAASLAVDIVMNDTDVIPGSDTDPRLVRLEQGLLDTLIEHVLSATPDGLNTWERFARRGEEGVTWAVLAPGSEPDAGLAAALPPADLGRVRAALAQGEAVVVAAEPRLRGVEPFADWWRVSDDGSALGIGYRGWGTELTEEGATTQPSMQTLAMRKEAIRVEQKLEEFRRAYNAWIQRGGDPYAHLRDHPALVNPFDDTQPIIAALADTLPYITAL